MKRYAVAVLVGLGIGYTCGYLQGDAGDRSVVDQGLTLLRLDRAGVATRTAVAEVRKEEAHRQFVIDSMKQARVDSIASMLHP